MQWISYRKPSKNKKYLFKFLSSTHLEYFLSTGNIYFSRADKFGDKMECVRIADLRKEKPDIPRLRKLQKKHLISCWHHDNKEMLAFWDTFAHDPKARKNFALRFKTDYLLDIFGRSASYNWRNNYKMLYGDVRYKNLVSLKYLEDKKIKHPAFRKEFAFRYENEFRFVIRNEVVFKEEGFGYRLGIAKNLEFDILVNPFLKKDDYELCNEKIKNSEFADHLQHSVLTRWLRPDLW